MADDEDAAFIARLEEEGEPRVRANYEHRRYSGHHKDLVAEWLYTKAWNEATDARAQADLALNEARRAAAAAERSAEANEHVARWTFWVAIIALVTVVASVMRGCFQGPIGP
ncbi:MAG TPA: hypothetical protein VEG60_10565 [Candidatus Binatia bacterium]|nr:hypothetical protein [Candidatus Binatia bacterium]